MLTIILIILGVVIIMPLALVFFSVMIELCREILVDIFAVGVFFVMAGAFIWGSVWLYRNFGTFLDILIS